MRSHFFDGMSTAKQPRRHAIYPAGRRTVIWKGLVCALILTRLAPAASTWPPQLEMRVPFEPTAFPSDGRTYLTYELYLTNFAANPITLRRVEVLDADDSAAAPIAAFEAP